MKITEKIYESLSTWGNNPVFIELAPERTPLYISAQQFKDSIIDMVNVLKKFGIRKGYIVLLFLNNSVDFISIYFALIEIGAKPIPINVAYRKLELDEIFSNADPHAIITEHDHIPILKSYLSEKILIERKTGKLMLLDTCKAAVNREPADIDDAIASINYTYRGYGYPLGAMVPHTQYLFGAEILEEAVQLNPGERLLVILPMPHIFTLIGCVFLPILYKITSVISYSRNPLRLFEYIQEYKINNILAVPELYELLFNLKDSAGDITPLKAFLSGGSVLAKENFSRLIDTFNIDLIHGYGLTEFTPVSRNIRRNIKPGTIGTVCNGLECRIGSPDANGLGEIMIKTENMTKSYYKLSAETLDAFDNGWFKTGDIGRMEDGYLSFEREKKGTRKVKGSMVDLKEVQKALMLYPKITDVYVECKENILFADIIINSKKKFNEEQIDIKNFLKGKIAEYKIPKVINKLLI